MKMSDLVLLNLFYPFVLFGEVDEELIKRAKPGWNGPLVYGKIAAHPKSEEKKFIIADIEKKTIETVLSGKNRVYVKAVLGEPDEIRYSNKTTYYIYDKPELKFKNGGTVKNGLIVVLINHMVSRIIY